MCTPNHSTTSPKRVPPVSLSLFLIRSFGESLLSAAAAADFVAGGGGAVPQCTASPAGGTSVVRVLFSRYVTDCGRRMVVVVVVVGIAHVEVYHSISVVMCVLW